MTTWYIAPTGDDTTGNGTIGTPYLTVAKCHTVGANGDTVICADGIYRQYGFTISKTNWTIQAAVGATPIFIAGHAYTSWSKTGGQTNVYEAAYTSSANRAVWNGSTKLTSTASIAACDAATDSFYFDNPNDKLYVNIGGSAPTSIEAYDVGNDQALKASGTGFTLTGITFRYQMQSVSIRAGSSTVSNCTFLNWVGFSNISTAFSELEITTGTTHNVTGCTFTGIGPQAPTIGAAAAANSVTIQNCTITSGYQGITLAGGTGHLIDNCTVSGCTDNGIQCAGTGTISNCICHDNAGYQILATVGGSVTISYCTAYNATATNSYGIGVITGSGYIIDHCTAHDGYRDGIYVKDASATVRYCTAYNFGHAGIWVGEGTGSKTIVVHHCAVYINTAVASGPTGAIYGFVCDPPAATMSFYHCIAANLKVSSLATQAGFFLQQDGTVVVENCITIDNALGFDAVAAYTPTLTADYNCVYGCTTAYTGDWSAGAHDVAADPKFVDLANFDFNLLAGSPCIDAGVYVAGINDGYKGSAPDIGLYESTPTAKIGVFAAPFQGAFG